MNDIYKNNTCIAYQNDIGKPVYIYMVKVKV